MITTPTPLSSALVAKLAVNGSFDSPTTVGGKEYSSLADYPEADARNSPLRRVISVEQNVDASLVSKITGNEAEQADLVALQVIRPHRSPYWQMFTALSRCSRPSRSQGSTIAATKQPRGCTCIAPMSPAIRRSGSLPVRRRTNTGLNHLGPNRRARLVRRRAQECLALASGFEPTFVRRSSGRWLLGATPRSRSISQVRFAMAARRCTSGSRTSIFAA